MPLTSTLLHPRLFRVLGTNFWKHLVTIQQRTVALNSTGEQVPDGWLELPGHVGISCNLANDPSLMQMASEKRTDQQTFSATVLHCMLDGYYPLIVETMRAVIDGVVYDIRGVVHGSAQNHTKLMLEVIS